LRICLFDHDHALVLDDFGFHLLLFGRFQVALVLGFLAHALDGIHQIALLGQECVAQIGGPLNVVCEAIYYIRQSRESLDAGIPCLFGDGISKRFVLEVLVLLQPLLELDNLKRVGGCS
jgi:hypothetical protein